MAIIKCPNCGNDVSDRAEKCPKCSSLITPGTGNSGTLYQQNPGTGDSGTLYQQGRGQAPANMPVNTNKAQKKKKSLCLTGQVVGALMIAFGMYILFAWHKPYDISQTARSASFGADFYTYEYEATTIAVNNLADIEEILTDNIGKQYMFYGGLCIFLGCAAFVYFSVKSDG